MTANIPFAALDVTAEDLKAVEEVILSGWLAHGKYSARLETLFCELTGAQHATTVSNCTAGLHLSCLAAGFGPGDEVIVPAQTHTATAHAVEYTGARAVFADVDPVTANIRPDEIEKCRTTATRGVIPVHMAGYPCEMEKITALCRAHDWVLIEDCAHAIGTTSAGKHVGNFGITGSFSFYPTKQITTGEGGVVISNDESIIARVRTLKAFGIDTPPELRTKPGVYDVQSLGYNYRMTDFQAALGAGQMERYASNLAARKTNGKRYAERLSQLNSIQFPAYSEENSYFLFQILLTEDIDRDRVLLGLKEAGIGVSIHYATPVPLMSHYRNKYGYVADDYPAAVRYGNQSISLPVHPKVSGRDIDFICDTLTSLLE